MATNLGTAIGYLTLDITGFTRGIDEATRQMDRMGTASSSTLANIGTSISKLGTGLTAAVTAPVVGFGASILKEGTTFEEAMTQVKNVANLANSDIGTFRQAVKDLGFQMVETGDDAESMFKTMYMYAVNQGSETRFTAEEVASALYYMGLAGWDATKMMQGLRPVLDLSAATGEDLARVSDIVTDSMNALGIEVQDLSSYTNVLAEMTRSSNTTLDQAGEAFKYVAPLAGALGYSMQDIAIAIGEFANVGVKGSQAGTGLRQALNSLTNPSERAKEVLDRLNWSIYDTYGNAKPFMQVMTELRDMFNITALPEETVEAFTEFTNYLDSIGEADTFDNMSLREQISMFSEWASTVGMDGNKIVTEYQKVADVIKLVGIRALPGMLGIINATDDNFNNLTKSVYGADEAYNGLGTAVGMADELMDTTQGSIYKLTSSISELRIQLFEFLQGPFQTIIDKVTDLVKWFNSLDDATQKNIMNWAGIAAAVGPVLLIVGKLLTAIASISSGFKLAGMSKDGFAKNITGTLNPALKTGETAASKFAGAGGLGGILKGFLGIGSVALGGVTAIWSFVDAWQKGHDIIHGLLIVIGTALAGLGAVLLGAPALITAIIAAVVAVVANLVLVIKDHWKEVKEILAKAWEGIKSFFSGIIEGVENLLGFIANAIDNFVIFIFETIPDMLSELLKNIGEWFSSVISSVGTFFSNVGSKISQWLADTVNSLSNWFSDLIGKISQWFTNIFDSLSSLISNVVDTIATAGANIMDGISNVFSMIGSGIQDLANTFMNIFTSLFNGVMSALSSIGSAISSFVSGVVSTISSTIDTIVGFISGLAQSIASALGSVFSTLQSLFESFVANLNGVLTNIGNFIVGVIANLGGFIKSLWQSITSMVTEFGAGIGQVLSTVGEGIASLVGSIGSGIGSFLSDIASKIGDGIKGVVSSITNGFSGIWSEVYNVGKNIIGGIVEGIKSSVTSLGSSISSVCTTIVDGVKRALKIGSPSKVMADEIGRWLPPGIVEGFDDAMPEAQEDINDSLDDMIDNVNADDSLVSIGTSYSDLQTVLADSYSLFADSVQTTEERLNASLDSMYERMYALTMLNKELSDGIISNTGYIGNTTKESDSIGGVNTTNNNSGNTFIFNSPKPIDEIEAARQLEKTQRDIEEGFI